MNFSLFGGKPQCADKCCNLVYDTTKRSVSAVRCGDSGKYQVLCHFYTNSDSNANKKIEESLKEEIGNLGKYSKIVEESMQSFQQDINTFSNHRTDIKNLQKSKKTAYTLAGLSLGFNFLLILIVVYVMRRQTRQE